MVKRTICLLLVLAALLGGVLTAQAGSASHIFVDGKEVADAHAVLDNGVTYISAYNVTRALVPDVTTAWPSTAEDMVLTGKGISINLHQGRDYVVANGRYLYTPGQVRLSSAGELILPVRTLALALGTPLTWDSNGVYLTSGGTPLQSGDSFYNADQVSILARVIAHEAGNQPLAGQIAVGNVLLNRVKSDSFPSTLSGVVDQKGQFPGALNATPKAQHYIAAKMALDGAQTVPTNCFWFNGAGKSCWASRNKTLQATIGSHAFYGG